MAKTNIDEWKERHEAYKKTLEERRELRKIYEEGQAALFRKQLETMNPSDFEV